MALPIIAGRLAGTIARIAAAEAMQSKTQESRAAARLKARTRIEWYGKRLEQLVNATAKQRVALATNMVWRQTKLNIGQPVLKYKGIRSNRKQVLPESRSKRGEYPKADTTTLKKDLFMRLDVSKKGVPRGYVGTTKHYGLLLETRMDRSFLRRTLLEMQPQIRVILVKKM